VKMFGGPAGMFPRASLRLSTGLAASTCRIKKNFSFSFIAWDFVSALFQFRDILGTPLYAMQLKNERMSHTGWRKTAAEEEGAIDCCWTGRRRQTFELACSAPHPPVSRLPPIHNNLLITTYCRNVIAKYTGWWQVRNCTCI